MVLVGASVHSLAILLHSMCGRTSDAAFVVVEVPGRRHRRRHTPTTWTCITSWVLGLEDDQ